MTVVQRTKLPYCEGCVGMNGWSACSSFRQRRHRHGDLPAENVCSLWVCGECRRPSQTVYQLHLDPSHRQMVLEVLRRRITDVRP